MKRTDLKKKWNKTFFKEKQLSLLCLSSVKKDKGFFFKKKYHTK